MVSRSCLQKVLDEMLIFSPGLYLIIGTERKMKKFIKTIDQIIGNICIGKTHIAFLFQNWSQNNKKLIDIFLIDGTWTIHSQLITVYSYDFSELFTSQVVYRILYNDK